MKVIVVVLALLIVGTVTGYVVGSRLSEIEAAEATLHQHTRVVFSKGDEKVALDYVCKGRVLSSYDVDSEKLISTRLTAVEIVRLQQQTKNRETLPYQRIYDGMVAFVVGGGVIKYSKPVTKILQAKENNKYTIAGIIGGLSGFYLGFELASLHLPACDSIKVVPISQSEEAWKILKRSIAAEHYLQAQPIADAPSAETLDVEEGPTEGAANVAEGPKEGTPNGQSKPSYRQILVTAGAGQAAAVVG